MYQNSVTMEWTQIAWDFDKAMGISSGLGGTPAPDYCILECEQWNSPLYCNSNHTQASTLEPLLIGDRASCWTV